MCATVLLSASWTEDLKGTLFFLFLFPARSSDLPRITTIHLQMAAARKYTISPPPICLSIEDDPVRPEVIVSLPPKVLPTEAIKPHTFPEGGLKANLTVLGAFMAFACTFGQMSAFGTYQAWYASHQLQHLSASTISWIGSLQFWVFFFSVRLFPSLFRISTSKSFDSNSFLIVRVLP